MGSKKTVTVKFINLETDYVLLIIIRNITWVPGTGTWYPHSSVQIDLILYIDFNKSSCFDSISYDFEREEK